MSITLNIACQSFSCKYLQADFNTNTFFGVYACDETTTFDFNFPIISLLAFYWRARQHHVVALCRFAIHCLHHLLKRSVPNGDVAQSGLRVGVSRFYSTCDN